MGGIGLAIVLVSSPHLFQASPGAGGSVSGTTLPPILGIVIWLVGTALCFLLGFLLARIIGWGVVAAVPHSEANAESITPPEGT
jgi:hypothetical protein